MGCKKCSSANDSFFGYCNACSQQASYLEKYPGLQSFLSLESISLLAGKVSASDNLILECKCQVCQRQSQVKLISVLKQYRRHTNAKRPIFYRCLRCSKAGVTHLTVDTVQSVIDIESTMMQFGGLPKNVKHGKVVAICEDCHQSQTVKLSSLLHQARRHRMAGRTCIYKCFRCGITREDAVVRSAVARAKQLSNGFRSCLETAMTNRLTTLGISFWSQHAVGLYTWDFFLPDFGILIDVDGEYWHSRHDRICKDTAKMTYTQRYFPEYRTVRIEEKNFLNPAIVDRLLLALLGQLPAPVKIDFDFANVSVDKVGGKGDPVDVYRSFLDSYHYAQCGRPGFVVYGAVLASELIAVCKFNSVTRQGTPAARGLKCHEVLELDRFCIHPSYQKKNFASWFLSRCISRVFSDYSGIAELVSFADETFGHSGTIYAASNWVYIGHTRPSYHYMDPLGVAINKKRVYDIASKLKMTEREYADKHELAQFAEKPKAKYVFPRRNRRITSSITRLQ